MKKITQDRIVEAILIGHSQLLFGADFDEALEEALKRLICGNKINGIQVYFPEVRVFYVVNARFDFSNPKLEPSKKELEEKIKKLSEDHKKYCFDDVVRLTAKKIFDKTDLQIAIKLISKQFEIATNFIFLLEKRLEEAIALSKPANNTF